MFTDYCCTYPPVMSGPVGVMNIYYIQADESYNVVHIPVDDHWVMLHTISGSGQLRLEKQSYNRRPSPLSVKYGFLLSLPW